ncbi:mechanosensitive ion channel [bacterium]|nr:mechanosensitive ion channel [bacterium]
MASAFLRLVVAGFGTAWLIGTAEAQQTVQQAAFIQPQPVSTVEINVTPEAIEARRKAAAELSDLDDETKKKIDSLYAQALDNLKKIADARTQAAQFRSQTESVQQRAQALKDHLEKLRNAKPTEPSISELPELEAELTRRKSQLAELKAELAAAEAEPGARANRQRDVLAQQSTVSQRRDELQKQIDAQPPAGEPMAQTDARRTELVTRRQLLEEEAPLLQNELACYAAEEGSSVLRLIRDVSTEEVAFAEKELRLLEQKIAVKQAEAAAAAVEKAREEAEEFIAAQPLLRPIAKENESLAQIANDLIAPLEATRKDLEQTTTRLDGVEKLFTDIQQKVDSLGLTGAIGARLRRERNSLPNLYRRKQRVRDRRTVIEDEQFKLFGYEDERARLSNQEAAIALLVSEAVGAGSLTDSDRKKLTAAARDVLNRKADYLDQLITRYKSYLDALYSLDLKEQELIRRTEEFRDYIDERVLWIRSNNPLYQSLSFDDADRLLISPKEWTDVLTWLVNDAGDYLALFGVTVLIAVLLIVTRPRLRRELNEAGAIARKGTCSTIGTTLRSAWLTVLLSVLWPAIALLVGLRLMSIAGVSEFGRAVGSGLQSLAVVGLSLEFLRNVCRPHGLADDHFDWPDSSIAVFRRTIPKLLVLALPIAFLTTTLYHCDPDHGADLPERVCFVVGTIVLSIFLRRTLRPESGVLCEYLSNNRGRWLDRLKLLWYWGGVLSPLVLGVLAASGFYYTAYQLAWRLFATILFLVAVQLVRAFLQRLLIVQKRRIRIEQLRQRREEAAARAAEQQSGESPASGTPLASVPLDELKADVESSTEQSRRLLSTALIMTSLVGTWMIWVDVLPALRFLDRWPLWTTTVEGTGTEPSALAEPAKPGVPPLSTETSVVVAVPQERVQPVTIIHLSVAVLIAVLTIAAARNLPGLIELWVLQKLPLDQSVRYAIRALTSYSIVLLGVILSFNAIYVGWAQVQWLATALTFGLAFGLQEIFANFVAGLILLFERPIRVGDVVTVDDVSGVVSRIRIRATTITNWDRKEYVIPNKEFITGRMLNWTLSDKVNRIVINVGIAYGSNTELARRLLAQICDRHPLLLKDPAPIVTFEGFGDNTLNLVVRTYLPDLENRLATIHELHTQINDEFKREGIEIAFPQRDLHIRSIDPVAASRLRGEASGD